MKNWKTLWEELTRQKSAFRLVLIGAAGLLVLALARPVSFRGRHRGPDQRPEPGHRPAGI